MKAREARIISNQFKRIVPYTAEEIEATIKESAERGTDHLYIQETPEKYIDDNLINKLMEDGYKVFYLKAQHMIKISW